jgi:hypothetical protein
MLLNGPPGATTLLCRKQLLERATMGRWNRQAFERAERKPSLIVVRRFRSRPGENRKRDAMMGKREIEPEERRTRWRSWQARQNPQAAPAVARLLEEDAVAPPHEGVRLRQVDGSRFLSLDRQHRRMSCAAESADWTFAATRLTRKADHRAEVHLGGVVFARAGCCDERGRSPPEMSATRGGIDRDFAVR